MEVLANSDFFFQRTVISSQLSQQTWSGVRGGMCWRGLPGQDMGGEDKDEGRRRAGEPGRGRSAPAPFPPLPPSLFAPRPRACALGPQSAPRNGSGVCGGPGAPFGEVPAWNCEGSGLGRAPPHLRGTLSRSRLFRLGTTECPRQTRSEHRYPCFSTSSVKGKTERGGQPGGRSSSGTPCIKVVRDEASGALVEDRN